jgi:hypothetical protein
MKWNKCSEGLPPNNGSGSSDRVLVYRETTGDFFVSLVDYSETDEGIEMAEWRWKEIDEAFTDHLTIRQLYKSGITHWANIHAPDEEQRSEKDE